MTALMKGASFAAGCEMSALALHPAMPKRKQHAQSATHEVFFVAELHLVSLRGFGETPLSFAHHHPGHSDAHEIQSHQNYHEKQHRGGVWRRCQNSGQNSDHKNRVAKILQQEFGRHDAEEREKKNQHGQFKDESKAKQHEKDQIEILVDIYQRDDRAAETV